ncbi:Hsp70 family protein [Pseudolysobacter antarcticus]|uniref:Hsp70 family protein n=1 Tax=Pseudolysobacter antarcticus TaxID=2511995 RepID=A0A411HJ28_9GAMM|nr:Hsp70 family protein [Pseudolysobacter antarcticus]QBB70536.1 Hsp70 family protein [Pseudolysobacter antarcticus]
MPYYAGIDLGTTNSAIYTFDGETLKLWKSPDGKDVTPSAIYFDRRSKYFGTRAYDMVPQDKERAAILFKRVMGTSTPIKIKGLSEALTPEQCSAEILKVLFGYLPEEIRSQVAGTVITVPAAFNQMQKDATMQAAELAGIGAVQLMQEPVAAVMSVMRARPSNGTFIIYDLGGGTLDVAIAEGIDGRVSLSAHGGIEMCGGRDWDRAIVTNVVRPWLEKNFKLPEDVAVDPKYKRLIAMLPWAAEKAKIDLSSRSDALVSLSEAEVRLQDINGTDIYVEAPITREVLDQLIDEQLKASIEAVRETMNKAGLSSQDIDRVVFVGGPTQYKTVRDRVAFELGISGAMDVDPMTAVAAGAAVFAESVDWASARRGRKSNRGSIAMGNELAVSFHFNSRTPNVRAQFLVTVTGQVDPGAEFQIESLETGWSSGRLVLKDGASVDLMLSKLGENQFKIFVFGAAGVPLALKTDRISITRTAASIDAIPASHSIGVEARTTSGGASAMCWLVRSGDLLPMKGQRKFFADESLRAGSNGALVFKLWEGEIVSPASQNRLMGALKVKGTDIEQGVIARGAELICDYEVSDSGLVTLEVSVPSIAGTFRSGHNFYSRMEGQIDYTAAGKLVLEEGTRQLERLDAIAEKINDPQIEVAREKLDDALSLSEQETDPEKSKQAMDHVHEAKRLIAKIREAHLKVMRRMDLDGLVEYFNDYVREHAKPSEASQFENAVRNAGRAIESNDAEFENLLDDLRGKNWDILWRQDSFVLARFQYLAKSAHLFVDQVEFTQLVTVGEQAAKSDDMQKLREVVLLLNYRRIRAGDDDMTSDANIIQA